MFKANANGNNVDGETDVNSRPIAMYFIPYCVDKIQPLRNPFG